MHTSNGQLTSDSDAKLIQGDKVVFLTYGTGTPEYSM